MDQDDLGNIWPAGSHATSSDIRSLTWGGRQRPDILAFKHDDLCRLLNLYLEGCGREWWVGHDLWVGKVIVGKPFSFL